MDEARLERDVLGRLPLDRRPLVKRLVITSAFATPVVASFTMDGLPINQAAVAIANSWP